MKYPNKIIKDQKKVINYANRGMTLESDLNITNQYYIDNNIAIINKKATPIKVTKVTYNATQKPLITEGFFQTPSTTDYNGVYKGRYIDFEAKETKNKKGFPINNLNQHQINHIKRIINHNGIVFIIIRWTTLSKTFLLKGEDLINFTITNKEKAIPISFFEKHGFIIKETFSPRLDYINIVNRVYFGGN